jgi:DNA-binding response OmpR family regulator
MKTRILIVADDAGLRAMVARALLQAGHGVELAENARRAREVITRESVDLAILAPRGVTDVTELAREIKDKVGHVILVTENGQATEPSLEALVPPSARISKPFAGPDLLAKITSELNAPAIATRDGDAAPPRGSSGDGPSVLVFEGYTLDADARSLTLASGRDVALTRAEFSLLLAFARQPGRVLSRDALSYVVAGRAAEPDDRSVDVLISRLRRKIEPEAKTPRLIVTMPGEGYKFTARPDAVDVVKPKSTEPSPVRDVIQAADDVGRVNVAARSERSRILWIGAMAVAVLLVAITGWTAWQTRTVSREIMQAASAAPPSPAAIPAATAASDQERREAAYKRMVTAMQDDHYNWRTIERLAIDSGVTEDEAHEILAEHPQEVVLGKSREGKLLARLADR